MMVPLSCGTLVLMPVARSGYGSCVGRAGGGGGLPPDALSTCSSPVDVRGDGTGGSSRSDWRGGRAGGVS